MNSRDVLRVLRPDEWIAEEHEVAALLAVQGKALYLIADAADQVAVLITDRKLSNAEALARARWWRNVEMLISEDERTGTAH